MPKKSHFFILLATMAILGTGCIRESASPQSNGGITITTDKNAYETTGLAFVHVNLTITNSSRNSIFFEDPRCNDPIYILRGIDNDWTKIDYEHGCFDMNPSPSELKPQENRQVTMSISQVGRYKFQFFYADTLEDIRSTSQRVRSVTSNEIQVIQIAPTIENIKKDCPPRGAVETYNSSCMIGAAKKAAENSIDEAIYICQSMTNDQYAMMELCLERVAFSISKHRRDVPSAERVCSQIPTKEERGKCTSGLMRRWAPER